MSRHPAATAVERSHLANSERSKLDAITSPIADTVECQGKIIAALTDTDNPHLERGIGWEIVGDCRRCGGVVVIGFNKAIKIKIGHG